MIFIGYKLIISVSNIFIDIVSFLTFAYEVAALKRVATFFILTSFDKFV